MSIVKAGASQSYGAIEELLGRIRSKRANAEPDPGGYEGGSSHPTTDVDNSTQAVAEGERSSENTSDVKSDVAASVDAASESSISGDDQDGQQLNIGTHQSATGEDPSSETGATNDSLPDPGNYEGESTSHPANLDNSEVTHKYASELRKKIASVQQAGTDLLAKLAMSGTNNGKPQPAGNPQAAATSAGDAPKTAAAEGADAMDGAAVADAAIDAKKQADVQVLTGLAETIKYAEDNAVATQQYLQSFFAHSRQLKEAEEDGESGGDGEKSEKSEGGSDSESSSGDGEDSGGEGGSAPPVSESPAAGPASEAGPPAGPPVGEGALGGGGGEVDALVNMLGADPLAAAPEAAPGGGEAATGGDPAAAAGADPALAAMGGDPAAAGGDPAAALGGDPAGGDPAGGGMPTVGPESAGPQDQAAMIAEILAQLGITPEMLEAKAAAHYARNLPNKAQVPAKGQWQPRSAEQKAAFESIKQSVQEILGSN